MKPKNKYQRAILEESRRLKPLTEAQRKSAVRKSLPHLAKRNAKGECYCLECGGSWTMPKNDKSEEVVCPHCGTKLEIDGSRRNHIHNSDHFGVVTRHNGYQVVRIYLIDAHLTKGKPVEYHINEVFQRWIDKNGMSTIVGRKFSWCFYNATWVFDSKMEIRGESYAYSVIPCCICGRMSVLPEIRRNGFKGNFYGISPRMLFQGILSDNRIETMLKVGQIEMLRYFIKTENKEIDKLWQYVKICIRNRYTIKDATLWTDLISALAYCGKDLHNPKYICPDDLQSAHNHWIKKREEKQTKERIERERQRYFADLEQRKIDEQKYRKAKSKFFGIVITDGTVCIKVLDSVQAFYEEGAALHHCVATNKYYNKSKSLVLSATVGGKAVETIEISLETLEILQCRGKYNQNTEHHDRIISLMKANMNQVARCMVA